MQPGIVQGQAVCWLWVSEGTWYAHDAPIGTHAEVQCHGFWELLICWPARLCRMQLGDAVEHRVLVPGTEVRVITAGTGSPAVLFDSPHATRSEAWSLVAPTVAEKTR